jgi:hypothetical protein
MRSGGLLVALLVPIGCATHFVRPLSGADLQRYDSAPALVAYLSQPDADPAVCDLSSEGPHVVTVTPAFARELVSDLAHGGLAPEPFAACVRRLLTSAERDRAADLMDAMGPHLSRPPGRF